MTLSARGIAAQGFALSPIAIAVQGLIAALVEEEEIKRAQGPGGKRRKSYSPTHTPPHEELTREVVERQWDLLEIRLRNQAEDAAARKAAVKPATVAPAVDAAIEPVAVDPLPAGTAPRHEGAAVESGVLAAKISLDAIEATRKRQSDEDEAMLLLLLMA